MGLVEKLELDSKELELLKKQKFPLKDERISSTPVSKTAVSIKAKIELEARRRMLKSKLESLPSGQQIDRFHVKIHGVADRRFDDGNYCISYMQFKKVMSSAPEEIKDFITAKTFLDLLLLSKEKGGNVPIKSLMVYIHTKKYKLEKYIALQYYDSCGKGFLTPEDLCEYIIEEIIPRIPSLRTLTDEQPMMLSYYLCIAKRKFFFLLDPLNQGKIRIIDIIASRLLDEFDILINPPIADDASTPTSESNDVERSSSKTSERPNWFSKENCLRIEKLYRQLDTNGNGLLSFEEMSNFRRITRAFMQRVFEICQTYENGELDLRGFCDFLLAIENKSDKSSMWYYFRILDVDGDNMLNANDLSFFYRDLAEMFDENMSENSSGRAPLFEDVRNEIFDMCKPKNPGAISLKELIESKKGDTIVGMLTDLDCFLEYENREEVVYEEK